MCGTHGGTEGTGGCTVSDGNGEPAFESCAALCFDSSADVVSKCVSSPVRVSSCGGDPLDLCGSAPAEQMCVSNSSQPGLNSAVDPNGSYEFEVFPSGVSVSGFSPFRYGVAKAAVHSNSSQLGRNSVFDPAGNFEGDFCSIRRISQ